MGKLIRVSEYAKQIEIASKELIFKTDNPGGEWLSSEKSRCIEAGKNRYGSPARFGATTGYFNRCVLLPVSVISRIKGCNGEQSNKREDTISWLKKYMGKNDRCPPFEIGVSDQYFPFITVDYQGTPWVNEGNHRIMTAKELKWKFMPVELKYFSGGERNKDGLLSPDIVKKYDAEAIEKGYNPDDNFKAHI